MIVDTTQLLSLTKAAEQSGYLTESVLRGRIRRGDLEAVRIGSSLFVTQEALEALLRQEGVK